MKNLMIIAVCLALALVVSIVSAAEENDEGKLVIMI